MSTLKEHLRADLTTAIKARDELTAATLRMALTGVTTAEVAGTEQRELSDDDVVAVLGREAKKRRESAAAYDDAGRPELAARERDELGVLARYLPAQLGDDEVAAIITAAIAQVAAGGAQGPKAMGQVMKVVTPQVAGRADGSRVAAEVRRQLA